LDAIFRGFEKAITELEKYYNLHIRLICDIVRKPDEDIHSIVEWLMNDVSNLIVGIGISGGTGSLPRREYQKICERFKKQGYGITVHAGELEHPNSIIEAIDYLYADRIGHGITLASHPELFYQIEHKNIHFELCPTANEFIGLGKSNYQSIKEMIHLAKNCSINTDDELIFQTNLDKEFLLLIENRVIDEKEVSNLLKNTLNASFTDNKLKSHLYDLISKEG
jgi:adenosine deaminase